MKVRRLELYPTLRENTAESAVVKGPVCARSARALGSQESQRQSYGTRVHSHRMVPTGFVEGLRLPPARRTA